MRSVAGDHRTAARLGDVADQQTGPSIDLGQACRQLLQQLDQIGMSPVAIAGKPHHLPGLPIGGDRRRAGDAAARIAANGLGAELGRRGAAAE